MISVPIDGALPAEVLGEVRIHQQIYRLRPDVCGIARFQSPRLMTLSALGRTPATYHGLGSYFAPHPPLWDNPALARDDASACAIATRLSTCRAIVLRGNGAVTVGRTLEEAVVLAWFLEDAARVELEILATGLTGREFTADDAKSRAVSAGMLFERMWDWLVADDPSRQPMAVLPVAAGSQDRVDDFASSVAKGNKHVG